MESVGLCGHAKENSNIRLHLSIHHSHTQLAFPVSDERSLPLGRQAAEEQFGRTAPRYALIVRLRKTSPASGAIHHTSKATTRSLKGYCAQHCAWTRTESTVLDETETQRDGETTSSCQNRYLTTPETACSHSYPPARFDPVPCKHNLSRPICSREPRIRGPVRRSTRGTSESCAAFDIWMAGYGKDLAVSEGILPVEEGPCLRCPRPSGLVVLHPEAPVLAGCGCGVGTRRSEMAQSLPI